MQNIHKSHFFRISNGLQIGMIKLEARAKKNIINPLCFYAIPNIIIRVVTKASFLKYKNVLSFEERENGKIRYSINSKDFTCPGKHQILLRYISIIHHPERKRKREWRKDTLHWGKENFSNNITLSSNLPISQK